MKATICATLLALAACGGGTDEWEATSSGVTGTTSSGAAEVSGSSSTSSGGSSSGGESSATSGGSGTGSASSSGSSSGSGSGSTGGATTSGSSTSGSTTGGCVPDGHQAPGWTAGDPNPCCSEEGEGNAEGLWCCSSKTPGSCDCAHGCAADGGSNDGGPNDGGPEGTAWDGSPCYVNGQSFCYTTEYAPHCCTGTSSVDDGPDGGLSCETGHATTCECVANYDPCFPGGEVGCCTAPSEGIFSCRADAPPEQDNGTCQPVQL